MSKPPPAPKVPHRGEPLSDRLGDREPEKEDQVELLKRLGVWLNNLPEDCALALETSRSPRVVRTEFKRLLERRLSLIEDEEQRRRAITRLEVDLDTAIAKWRAASGEELVEPSESWGREGSRSSDARIFSQDEVQDIQRLVAAQREEEIADLRKQVALQQSELQEQKKKHEPPTRRTFLQKLGGVISTTLIGWGVVHIESDILEVHEFEQIEAMLEELHEGEDVKDIPFIKRDKHRKAFLKKYGKDFPDFFTTFLEKNVRPDSVDYLFSLLAKVDCQGLIYQAFENEVFIMSPAIRNNFLHLVSHIPRLGNAKSFSFGSATYSLKGGWMKKVVPNYWEKPEHYAVRAADWLPTSKTIHPHEIDPRWNGLARNGQINPSSTLTAEDIQERTSIIESVVRTLKEKGGWSSPARVERFKVYLDNQSVRNHLQASDCTLAEAYSVIKAAVHYEETHRDFHGDIVALLLDQRESFRAKKILSKDTQSFIEVSYTTKDGKDKFYPERLVQLADAAGVASEHCVVIDTQHPKAAVELWNSIIYSKGDTCIYFNTHGWAEGIALNEKIDFSYQELALALLERMKKVQDPQTLGEVTVITSACHGYDFITESFLAEMAKLYKKSLFAKKTRWEDIALPTIITQTQERELGWRNFSDDLVVHAGAIKKSGGLTGEILLRGVHPEHYFCSDMTFFAGDPGQWAEFAARDKAALGADEVVPV